MLSCKEGNDGMGKKMEKEKVKNKIMSILKSKELKILIYFIVMFIAFEGTFYSVKNIFDKENDYSFKGPDIDGDGTIGDIEGYGYLFGGFWKDIGGFINYEIKYTILMLPINIKQLFLFICIVIQVVAIRC